MSAPCDRYAAERPLTAKLLIIGVPASVLVIWMMLDYRIDVSTKGVTIRRALGIITLPGRRLPLDSVMDVVQIGGGLPLASSWKPTIDS